MLAWSSKILRICVWSCLIPLRLVILVVALHGILGACCGWPVLVVVPLVLGFGMVSGRAGGRSLSQCGWDVLVGRNFSIVISVGLQWCVGVNELEVGIRVGVCCLGMVGIRVGGGGDR